MHDHKITGNIYQGLINIIINISDKYNIAGCKKTYRLKCLQRLTNEIQFTYS